MNSDTSHPVAASTAGYVRSTAQRLWNCRLCKSVAFSVFVLILLIESIILIPSAYNFRDNALRQTERRGMTLVQSALLVENTRSDGRELQPLLHKLIDDQQLLGLRVLARDNTTLGHAGDSDFRDFNISGVVKENENVARRVTHDGTQIDIAWTATVGSAPVIVLARMDIAHVRGELTAFVLRIAGLIALIVGVVTTGTMAVLYRTVLGPILRLRRSMLLAAAEPDRADVFQVTERPRDELGEVFQTHNLMLTRIAESKRADRLRAEEQAQFLSRHDLLTHLPNRAFFIEHLREALPAARGRGEAVAVLVLNLAGFRGVNDEFGQHLGNHVLRIVARRLTQGAEGDFTARIGGDEFGVARIGAVTAEEAAALAERILARISQPVQIDHAEVRLKGRVGIAYSASDHGDAETILHDAELALLRIRQEDAGKFRFFAPQMAEAARRRQEIEREMRQALERHEFQLFYQPKVELAGADNARKIVACEALMRWRHPTRGMVPPLEFIPVAEATGLIGRLGGWAIHEGCRQVRRWIDSGLIAPRVAVNLSAHQFRDSGLPDTVRAALAASQIEPGLLELEITETVVMQDVERTAGTLSTLRELGIHLAIDDFGTGYSSLSYLRRFEVDSIKIDKSFVDDIGRDPNADAVCDAIIRLGHSLGKRIVAEGVETETQCAFLRQRRCEEAQGYFFGRPVPAADLVPMLALREKE